jgi:transposase
MQGEVAVEIVHARCSGLDVHNKSVVARVLISQPDGLIERHVRTFKTMTADLLALGDWLSNLGVTHSALESTGV